MNLLNSSSKNSTLTPKSLRHARHAHRSITLQVLRVRSDSTLATKIATMRRQPRRQIDRVSNQRKRLGKLRVLAPSSSSEVLPLFLSKKSHFPEMPPTVFLSSSSFLPLLRLRSFLLPMPKTRARPRPSKSAAVAIETPTKLKTKAMYNTEERLLRKRREKRAIFVSRLLSKKNEAKKKEKIHKRRGGVCDDVMMTTTTRDDRTRALVLI